MEELVIGLGIALGSIALVYVIALALCYFIEYRVEHSIDEKLKDLGVEIPDRREGTDD